LNYPANIAHTHCRANSLAISDSSMANYFQFQQASNRKSPEVRCRRKRFTFIVYQ